MAVALLDAGGGEWALVDDDVDQNVAGLADRARRLQGRPLRQGLNAHTGSVGGAAFLALADR